MQRICRACAERYCTRQMFAWGQTMITYWQFVLTEHEEEGGCFWSQGVLCDPLWLNKGHFTEGKAGCDPHCLSRSSHSYRVCSCPLSFTSVTLLLLVLIFCYRSVDGYRGWDMGCVVTWEANVLQTHLNSPTVYICLQHGGLEVITKMVYSKFMFLLSWSHKCTIIHKGRHWASTCCKWALPYPA